MAVKVQTIRATEGGPQLVVLPSQTPVNGFGPPLFNGGLFYAQYGASAAVANSTAEATLLSNTSSTAVTFYTQNSGATYLASTLALNAGLLGIGTILYGRVVTSASTTGTPNLTIKVNLNNATTGTSTYTLATTAATATGSGLSSANVSVDFECVVVSTGTSGSMISTIKEIETATIKANPAANLVTVDTTQPYTLDVTATWSAASASNTITTQYAWIGIRG